MSEQNARLVVTPEQEGQRVDVLVAESVEDLTRSGAQKLLADGNITVNGKTAGKSLKVKSGDILEINIPAPLSIRAEAQDIPLCVVYEDDDLLVVDKPKGMVVHPAPGNPDGTSSTRRRATRTGLWSTRSCTTAEIVCPASTARSARASSTASTRTRAGFWSSRRTTSLM